MEIIFTKKSAQKQLQTGIIENKNHVACFCYNQLMKDPRKMTKIQFEITNDEGEMT